MVVVSTTSDGVKANHRAVASISAITTNFTRDQPVSVPRLSSSAALVYHYFNIDGGAALHERDVEQRRNGSARNTLSHIVFRMNDG